MTADFRAKRVRIFEAHLAQYKNVNPSDNLSKSYERGG